MTPSRETVHTVVFDAGLTLLRAAPSFRDVFLRGCRDAGVAVTEHLLARHEHDLRSVWREHEAAWHEAGEPSPHIGDGDAERRFWQGLYRLLLERLGVDGDRDRAARAIHDAFLAPGTFRRYAEVDHVLETLASRGVRLGLLSNWSGELRDILRAEGLADRFHAIVVSAEEGVAKPDTRLFERTLARLGVEAEAGVVYVGDDRRCDIEPSRRLGLTAVLIDRLGRYPDHDGHRVTDLRGLLDVLPLPGMAQRR